MSYHKIKKPTLTLRTVREQWSDCTKCEIGCHSRNKVFVDRVEVSPLPSTKVDIVMIGEGPGLAEDLEGLPFVGPAGQLLRQSIAKCRYYNCQFCDGKGILHKWWDSWGGIGPHDVSHSSKVWVPCWACGGYGRARIRLVNLLLCRPYLPPLSSGKNREPSYEEVENCMPRLISTIRVLNPELIVTLGREPESYISAIRHDLEIEGFYVDFRSLRHPSAILRGSGMSEGAYVETINLVFKDFWNKKGKEYAKVSY